MTESPGDFEAGASEGHGYLVSSRGRIYHGSAKERRDITQYLAKTYEVNGYLHQLSLSPEHKWPAHLDDCMKVYDELLRQGYDPEEDDLYGGRVPEVRWSSRLRCVWPAEGKPQPAALVAFSPCTGRQWDFPLIPKT